MICILLPDPWLATHTKLHRFREDMCECGTRERVDHVFGGLPKMEKSTSGATEESWRRIQEYVAEKDTEKKARRVI